MRGGSCHAGCPASARDARSRDRDAAGRVLRAHGRQAGLLAANRDRGPSARHDAASPSFLAPPKTSASVRTIPLPQVVVGALAEHLATFAAHADGFVFTLGGKPVHRTAFGHLWRPVVKTAGLPTGTGFHAMRHYYASLLIRHGESVKTVQARLGHASAVETLDTYSHLWPDSDERSREAVDSVLGNPADCVRTSEARDSIPAGQRRVVDESAYRPDSFERTFPTCTNTLNLPFDLRLLRSVVANDCRCFSTSCAPSVPRALPHGQDNGAAEVSPPGDRRL